MEKFNTTESLINKINKDGHLKKDGFVMKALIQISATGSRRFKDVVASYIEGRYKTSVGMAMEAAEVLISDFNK